MNIVPLFKPQCLEQEHCMDLWRMKRHDHTPSSIKQRHIFKAMLSDRLQFFSMAS